jgi:hypothetical protein
VTRHNSMMRVSFLWGGKCCLLFVVYFYVLANCKIARWWGVTEFWAWHHTMMSYLIRFDSLLFDVISYLEVTIYSWRLLRAWLPTWVCISTCILVCVLAGMYGCMYIAVQEYAWLQAYLYEHVDIRNSSHSRT